MDREEADAIVSKMKAVARVHASPPLGPPVPECYHQFANGLKLCLTVDILSPEWIHQVGQFLGVNFPQELVKGEKFWHLSIARMGTAAPTPAEVEFWRRAFFEAAPYIERPGELPGINSRHFWWKYIL